VLAAVADGRRSGREKGEAVLRRHFPRRQNTTCQRQKGACWVDVKPTLLMVYTHYYYSTVSMLYKVQKEKET